MLSSQQVAAERKETKDEMDNVIGDGSGERTTGTANTIYDLSSVLFHALEGGASYDTYIDDAEREGDEELAERRRALPPPWREERQPASRRRPNPPALRQVRRKSCRPRGRGKLRHRGKESHRDRSSPSPGKGWKGCREHRV
jgi:hypothetical protein